MRTASVRVTATDNDAAGAGCAGCWRDGGEDAPQTSTVDAGARSRDSAEHETVPARLDAVSIPVKPVLSTATSSRRERERENS